MKNIINRITSNKIKMDFKTIAVSFRKPQAFYSLILWYILRLDFTNHEEDNDHIKIMKHNISTTTSTIVKLISFLAS